MKPIAEHDFSLFFWQRLLFRTGLLLIMLDKDGRLLFVSESSKGILGHKAGELIQNASLVTLFPEQNDFLRHSINQLPKCRKKHIYVELFTRHRNGDQIMLGGHLLRGEDVKPQDCICLLLRDISHEKQIRDKLDTSAAKQKKLNKYMLQAREKERKNIASTIHDDIGQVLTALKLGLGVVNSYFNNLADSQIKIQDMIEVVDDAVLRTQRISYELRPLVSDNSDPIAAISDYCTTWAKRTGIKINLNIDSVMLSNDIALAIFRVVQEALTNVARHAQASSVEIELQHTRSSLNLVIQDDGIGVTEDKINKKDAYGIMGMRERAEFCNGTLNISGEKGTRIELIVPFAPG